MFQAVHPTETHPVEVTAKANHGDFTHHVDWYCPRPSDQNDHRCSMVLQRLKPAIPVPAHLQDGI
ncbi:CLL_HP2_G0000870.mRNA.1.CDS.1 [Saccharomyces cerevisiae]|nr:CLL_HP2_G0000870.mRNA.1.CDS.1 [Saccharomyces cerevisiae]CAI6453209.1 CLL_HP2_G0000870.mRNA.1.CDS.1 [Saccharomyces cerevisiae]